MSFLNDIITENADKDVDASFGNFLRGFKKMKSIKESIDPKELPNELTLFIEENSYLSGQIPVIKRTLYKHWKKGEYSSDLAERAWSRIVSEGAKRYARDIGKEPRIWEDMFPENVRQQLVENLEKSFYQDLKKGKINMEELFNE
jgi:hypothetical protein